MWIKLCNGRVEFVPHEAHIKRLLSEGAHEATDPRVAKPEPEPVVKENKSDPDETANTEQSSRKSSTTSTRRKAE